MAQLDRNSPVVLEAGYHALMDLNCAGIFLNILSIVYSLIAVAYLIKPWPEQETTAIRRRNPEPRNDK
jgi:hypothetical protein